jgi:hypothetical protein
MNPRAGKVQLGCKEPRAATNEGAERGPQWWSLRGEPDFERIDQDMTAIMSLFSATTCPQRILRCHSNNLSDAVRGWGVWEALT